MERYDDDLSRFEADGAAPLPVTNDQGAIEHEGARIWYATYGAGPPVILLHGGLGHSGNWGYQVPALVRSGYHVVLIDSRGHGRSTRNARPYTYELMASDVSAVMDALRLEKAGLVGWSDGACTALILASKAPSRVAGVFFFACNMDPSGTKEITEFTPILRRCISRHMQDYERLSATPDQFDEFSDAVGLMQRTQPNYSARDLAAISVPVTIVHSEHDEFIKREHAEYLAQSIPNAEFIYLPGMSHFAPLQRPEQFNSAMLAFLGKVLPFYHVAQVNIGRILAPLDDPIMDGFVSRLDDLNALADQSPGFVWRLQTEAGNATDFRPYDDDRILVNLSVWETIEQLKQYVYKTAHSEIMRQRRQWFEKFEQTYMALWWIKAGHIPTVTEAIQRIKYLQEHGATPHAFTFKQPFSPVESEAGSLE